MQAIGDRGRKEDAGQGRHVAEGEVRREKVKVVGQVTEGVAAVVFKGGAEVIRERRREVAEQVSGSVRERGLAKEDVGQQVRLEDREKGPRREKLVSGRSFFSVQKKESGKR